MSDSCESCSSSESMEYQILPATPAYDEVKILLQQNQFLVDDIRFLSYFADCHAIYSGDLILGLYATVDYECARGCLSEKVRSAIDGLLAKAGGTSAAHLFFNSRIANVPLDMVHELYRTVRTAAPHYLVVSQLERQDKEAQKRACAAFPEFDPSDLRMWPRKEEEVFLLKYPARTVVDCGERKYRVSLLAQKELDQFRDDFGAELGHGKL